jgi:hypothetical protein
MTSGSENSATVPQWKLESIARRKALSDLMGAHKVTVKACRVDMRPDGDSDWHKSACHAAFEVLQNGRVVHAGHYSAGSLAALPDTLQAFRAAFKKGRKMSRSLPYEGFGSNQFGLPGDVKKAFELRQSGAKTLWESAILECVRRAWLPESVDVIQSLLSDATGESFESWCSELGYDTDSKKAERAYFDCREAERVMRRCFEPDSYYTALEIARKF